MINRYILFLLIVLFGFACKTEDKTDKLSSGFTVTDDLNRTLSFDKKPERIITLVPSLTEIVYDLNLERFLVGNTNYCNYPKEAQAIEKVGDVLTINFEKVIELKPDLIFISVEGNNKKTFDKLIELGFAVFVSNPRNYADIKKTYRNFAEIFDVEKQAEKNILKWDEIIYSIKNESKKYPSAAVMVIVDLKPVYLAGNNTFLDEHIKMCGLKNIAENAPVSYPIFSREEIIRSNPDVILYLTDKEEDKKSLLSLYPEWKNLAAFKTNKVFFVDRDLYSRPGSRAAAAVKDLFNRLHPQKVQTRQD